jgi:acyl-CoA reductase-like NAD-dependent aldehyde dehydrogenase
VFNVLHGDKEAVDGLLSHPDVQAVSFVGSTPMARYVYATGCGHGKRVQALGGAKNHMVVMPDADIDQPWTPWWAKRFLARCFRACAFTTSRRRCGLSTTTSTAMALPATPATAISPASSHGASRSAWFGINVPIPVPMAWHGFGGWKRSLFGDMNAYGEERRSLLHQAEVDHAALVCQHREGC